MPNLPSAASFVNDEMGYTPGVVEAVKAYADSKPWRGDRQQQFDKLKALHDELCERCEIECGLLEPSAPHYSCAVAVYHQQTNAIYTAGQHTVVGYLYAFAGALVGDDHSRRMLFAVNLFKRCFPRSFAAADLSGPTIRAAR